MRPHLVLAASVLALSSCSFTRFSDIQKDAPVVVIDGSSVGSGFGASLALWDTGAERRLAAGAVPGSIGAAEYELGVGQDPTTDALRTDLCPTGCVNAIRTAAVSYVADSSSQCFAVGYGEPLPPNNTSPGVRVHCADGNIGNLDITGLDLSTDPEGEKLVLSASAGGDLLVAASPKLARAWLYPSVNQGVARVDLVPPAGAGDSFGGSLAIFGVVGSTFALVGEPGANRVHVYQFDGSYAGCIASARPGFGRNIAVGRAGYAADLAVAYDGGVQVLHGGPLATLNETCSDADSPTWKVEDLECRTTADVESCDGSFGDALVLADLDADGDSEVLVGAPGVTVRGENSVGAVFVFDVEPDHPAWLSEAKFLSSGESGERLGTSLAVLRQQNGLEAFVAGAPGGGKAAIFYCPKLAGGRGSRCQ
jgi:FG-GAP repeat